MMTTMKQQPRHPSNKLFDRKDETAET
jgi:hypothetical protein